MNQRDLELLSTYLDGQLNPSDSARLESRLKSDPQLASVLTDLRATRSLLRKLPQRRAPHNFTLTRKMVGQNPPLPRAYPVFRFATALATLLFIFSFGLNSVSQLAAQPLYGMGGGGGSSEDTSQPFSAAAPAATQAPAATEAPAEQPPAAALAPTQVLTPEIANGAQIADTPASKAGDAANTLNPNQPLAQTEARSPTPAPLIPSIWQTILAIIAIASGLLMLLLRQLSAGRWK
jgi:anti-sigma factor RsiW